MEKVIVSKKKMLDRSPHVGQFHESHYDVPTNSDLCIRNMGAERKYNSETASL